MNKTSMVTEPQHARRFETFGPWPRAAVVHHPEGVYRWGHVWDDPLDYRLLIFQEDGKDIGDQIRVPVESATLLHPNA